MLTSTVTAKAQTTLPSGVRKALGVKPGDKVSYVIRGDEAVIRKAAAEEEQDPVLGAFLDFIERDMAEHPERLRTMPKDLFDRMRALTVGMEIDLDEKIEGPVGL
ncbi:MAG TPA: type II toxin-antitoxin system PrlF family antitoxin [Longimicrobium sp.]|nr:type II toxin-antitoxin system PrlF family antitoxin [Longimicrobium sp.]